MMAEKRVFKVLVVVAKKSVARKVSNLASVGCTGFTMLPSVVFPLYSYSNITAPAGLPCHLGFGTPNTSTKRTLCLPKSLMVGAMKVMKWALREQ
jgi:hypothetical protein